MAAATKSIGIGVTVATTYEPPYHLARRLSTIDHLSKGRFGWNIVTGYLDSAARNLIGKDQPMHDNRCESSLCSALAGISECLRYIELTNSLR